MRSIALVFAALAAGLVACARPVVERPTTTADRSRGAVVTSNVRRADYAGTEACRPCHSDLVERWSSSPMRRMTRRDAGSAQAPFDGRTFRFKDDTATLTTHGGARFVRIASPAFGDGLFRVTKVIGGRVREDYAGVSVPSVDAPAPTKLSDEKILPISFVLATGEVRYKGYSVQARERPGMRAGPVWSKTCIFCHNTVPLLDASLGALAGPRGGSYQGSDLDALLPVARRRPIAVRDPSALVRAVGDEVRALGREPHATEVAGALKEAISVSRAAFDGDDVVELGIGCESCHGGSREHVDDPTKRPSLSVVAPFLTTPKSTPAEEQSRACGRCHQVLFSQYPFTWEGGERRGGSPGGSTINSGEARDFLLGGCAMAMKCTTCHDPHAKGGLSRGPDLADARGDAICTNCHSKYAPPAAAAAHSHHPAASAGARCVSCHMPRKTMGLDGTLSRYHRIGSPTDAARVVADRPLECALCHDDRTVSQLVSSMETWWGKSYDRGALLGLYGSLDANVLRATIERGKPHEQAVAIRVLAANMRKDAAPVIARVMTSPVPLVRYWARDALVKLTGTASPVNLHQDIAAIERETAAWLGVRPATDTPKPPRGMDDDEE